MQTVIAIDVGFAVTGYAVLEFTLGRWEVIERGGLEAKKSKLDLRIADLDDLRMRDLARQLDTFVVLSTHAFVEFPGGGAQSARAMRGMALASGVTSAVLSMRGISSTNFSPRETRIAAAGTEQASKEHVIRGVQRRFPDLSLSGLNQAHREAAADALATFMAAEQAGHTKQFEGQ